MQTIDFFFLTALLQHSTVDDYFSLWAVPLFPLSRTICPSFHHCVGLHLYALLTSLVKKLVLEFILAKV